MKKAKKIDELPLFADDLEIGAAMLGRARASEWHGLAKLLERRGLPKSDPLMGARYVPAVQAFFDREYGLIAKEAAPRPPDGTEDLSAWNTKRQRSRRGSLD